MRIKLGIVVAIAIVSAQVRGSAAAPAPLCGPTLEGESTVAARGSLVKRACDGFCDFRPRLCLNQTEGACAGGDVRELEIRPARAGATWNRPWHLGTEPTCAAPTPLRLRAGESRTQRARIDLRGSAAVGGAARLTRTARWTLRCRPNPTNAGCDAAASGSFDPPDDPALARCLRIAEHEHARRVDLPPAVAVPGTCASELTSRPNYTWPATALADAPEELHVVAVEGGTLEPGAPPDAAGTVRVDVAATAKPVVLYLSALGPVRWVVTPMPGARIARVVVAGADPRQRVEGLPGTTAILERAPEQICISGLDGLRFANDTAVKIFIEDVRESTHLTETSLQVCGVGDRFQVPIPGAPAQPGPAPHGAGSELVANADVALAGCDAAKAEDGYCLTSTASGQLAVVGLESGHVCRLDVTLPGAGAQGVAGTTLGWRGEAVYACVGGVTLARASLRDGVVEWLDVPCGGASADATRVAISALGLDGLLSAGQRLLRFAPGREAILSDDWSAMPVPAFTRKILALRGEQVLSAATPTSVVLDVHELRTGAALAPLTLARTPTPIAGLAVVGAQRLALVGGTHADAIEVFDAASGQRLRQLSVGEPVAGLACTVGGGAS